MVPTEVFVRPLLLGEVHILIDLLGPGLLSSLVPRMNRESTERGCLLEGWEATLVARQLVSAALWVRIQTSLKNHKWAT